MLHPPATLNRLPDDIERVRVEVEAMILQPWLFDGPCAQLTTQAMISLAQCYAAAATAKRLVSALRQVAAQNE